MAHRLFYKDLRPQSDAHQRVYARFELAYTAVDFIAALCFVIGSVMFFSDAWQTPGTWLFLIGSICFAMKPTLRLVREIRMLAMGRDKELARMSGGDEG